MIERSGGICYVVLHYQEIAVTKQCIDSLLNIGRSSIIIVVDNSSPNHSGMLLKQQYVHNSRVRFVLNKTNAGFAYGNNLGYKYAKEHFSPDIIVVMNNDVIISQSDFEHMAEKNMRRYGLDLMGPDIITPPQFGRILRQNPFNLKALGSVKILLALVYCYLLSFLLKYGCIYTIYNNVHKKDEIEGDRVSTNNIDITGQFSPIQYTENCMLHGSCIIYGKTYIDNEDFAFVPGTFMYGEEYILYDYLKFRSYKTAVCPDVQVLHLGGRATSSIHNSKKKIIFKLREGARSYIILLKKRRSYYGWKFLLH